MVSCMFCMQRREQKKTRLVNEKNFKMFMFNRILLLLEKTKIKKNWYSTCILIWNILILTIISASMHTIQMQEKVKQIIAETLVKFRIGWYLTILMIRITITKLFEQC